VAILVAVRLVAVDLQTKTEKSVWPLLLTILVLMVTLTTAALIIVWIGRLMKRPPPDLSSSDELTRFRSLYESGDLNREEYERLKAKLVPRLRKELDLPAKDQPPAPPDAPPESPTP
jgi:hypothetical protein